MKLDDRLPPDFPFLADRPVWLFVLLLAVGITAIWMTDNLYFSWLHRRAPRLFRPRVLLAILAACVAFIAIGMAINPPRFGRNASSMQLH